MSNLTIYNRQDIVGSSYPAFDNSPTYQDSPWGLYEDALANDGTYISNTENGFRPTTQTVVISYSGMTFNAVQITTTSGVDRVLSESLSVNNRMVYIWTDIELSLTDFNLFDGAVLTEKYLQFNDTISGSNMNEKIWGYDGDDTLYGNGGNDELVGGKGKDSLYGGSGDDVLSGGEGSSGWWNDYYHGGSGFDVMQTNFGRYDLFISKDPISGETSVHWEDGYKLATISPTVEQLKGNDYTLSTDELLYLGDVHTVPYSATSAVHRFYNNRDKAFFYTSSKDEKDYVLFNSHYDRPNNDEWPYVYQGSTFEAAHSYLSSAALVPVFRFYNYETGHHFFTTSDAEAEMIKGKSASGEWSFNYEGTRFSVYSVDPTPNFQGDEIAVHRFYSPTLNRHFFTGDSDEATEIQLTGIWDYEGVAFYGEILG